MRSDQRGSQLALEQITKHYGATAAVADVSLEVAAREFLTVLGPSGSGKTTVLRMIGGFVAPDAGRILIDGQDVVRVPVERRPTAMLFQQLSLWPHMTVARNISFGLEIRKRPRREIERRVAELLEIVGLADFGARLPSQLSGGEQQRVALARSLALEPRILLLDEPFSALDTKLRVELRTFVRNLQREVGTTTILVTHDQEEALELSDRIVVMHNGRIEQIGRPNDIYDGPKSAFVGEFLGAMNFVSGRSTGSAVVLADGSTVALGEPAPALPGTPRIGVRPEDVVVTGEPAPGEATFAVVGVVPKGHYQQLTLQSGDSFIHAYVGKDFTMPPGSRTAVRFRRIHLFADGDDRAAGAPSDAGPATSEPLLSTEAVLNP